MVGGRRGTPGMEMLLKALLYLAWAVVVVILLQVTTARDERTVPLAMALIAVGATLGILSALGLTLRPRNLRPSIHLLLSVPREMHQPSSQWQQEVRPEGAIEEGRER